MKKIKQSPIHSSIPDFANPVFDVEDALQLKSAYEFVYELEKRFDLSTVEALLIAMEMVEKVDLVDVRYLTIGKGGDIGTLADADGMKAQFLSGLCIKRYTNGDFMVSRNVSGVTGLVLPNFAGTLRAYLKTLQFN